VTAHAASPEDIGCQWQPVPRNTVAAVELDGEALLYDRTTGSLHVLDRLATIVWRCFDGTVTLRQLAVELAEEFRADETLVEEDLVALAVRLGKGGLLEGVVGDPDVIDASVPEAPGEGPGGCP
jgi:hypothetical protein